MPSQSKISGNARRITRWKRSEIETLFKQSRRVYSSQELDIRLAASQEKDFGRLLFIIPRSCGNAPARNTFKRRIKSLFYQEKLYTSGCNWIIFCKKEGLVLDFQSLKKVLLKAQEHCIDLIQQV